MAKEDKLKMKFKLKGLEFEIEGKESTVKKEFENFKSFVTGDLLPIINVEKSDQTQPLSLIDQQKSIPITQAEDITHLEAIEIPTLKDIKLRDLAKTETDWMTIYSFISSNAGSKTFTRSDIIDLYKESGRFSDKKTNGISQYLKNLAKSELIKATSDSEFIILDKCKERANQIFKGNSKSKNKRTGNNTKSSQNKSTTKAKSNSKSKFEFTLDKNLNLRPDGKKSLKDFSDDYDINSTPKQIILIIYYLKNELGLGQVSGNQIYTGLDSLGVRIPQSLKQIIINTKGRRHGWIDYDSLDDISLSIKGKNVIKHDLHNK